MAAGATRPASGWPAGRLATKKAAEAAFRSATSQRLRRLGRAPGRGTLGSAFGARGLRCRRGSRLGGRGRWRLGGIALPEFLDAAGGVHNLLLARIKRMASRAHLDMQRLLHGRTGGERVAAAARHLDFAVLRVNGGFHQYLGGGRERRAPGLAGSGSRALAAGKSKPRRTAENYEPFVAAVQQGGNLP